MQFLIIAYDYDDAFERRMQSREQHIINTKKMMGSGNIVSALLSVRLVDLKQANDNNLVADS